MELRRAARYLWPSSAFEGARLAVMGSLRIPFVILASVAPGAFTGPSGLIVVSAESAPSVFTAPKLRLAVDAAAVAIFVNHKVVPPFSDRKR
jgi:hypothetical protein